MDATKSSTEVRWSDLKYIQRDPENKDQFANNWDRIFGKKERANEKEKTSETTKEILNATKEGLFQQDNR